LISVVFCLACPATMPAGRYVPIESTRARLYLEPSWEDATKQPGERVRFERGVGTLRPLLVSVTTVSASDFKTIKDVLDAREAAFGKSARRERLAAIRVSGVPAEKRVVQLDLRGETWATFLYGFTVDREHIVVHGFAKPALSGDSEADFDAFVAAIQLMAKVEKKAK
jgi:hypothetical protein